MLGGPSEPSRMGAQTGRAGVRFPYDARVSGASIEGRATAADGTTLLTRTWPAPPDPAGHVLIVHGLGEHSGRYEHVGRWLSEAGLAVHAADSVSELQLASLEEFLGAIAGSSIGPEAVADEERFVDRAASLDFCSHVVRHERSAA